MTDAHASGKKSSSSENTTSPLISNLSDVGSYSYSALCAISLYHLFEDDWHREFKKTALQMIIKHLQLPEQVCVSVDAIMCGQGIDDPQPFVDTVLKEDCLDMSGLPLVTDLVTLAISEGCYDSRMRVLIKYIAWQLRVSWEHVEAIETTMAETLEHQQYDMSEEEMKEKDKKRKKDKIKRFALIGLATVGGGTLIGLTGGLAAPLVAAGAGAIIGGAGAAALGTTAGVAIIGSLFGVAGAGLTGYKMRKRVGAIEEFSFEPLVWGGGSLRTQTIGKQLHVTIAVTGWLTNDMQDFKVPWKSLSESKEQYYLRWESKHLIRLGTAFNYILGTAMSVATQEALKYTVLSGLMAAIAWPGALISAAGVIDNPWSVCIQRSTAAGKALAEVLLSREQGNRPVTLAGFSLGARVIFSCLEELAKRKGSEGIVEDVILLGAPVSGNPKDWNSLTRVVAGKIINGYCRGDWLLKFLYRTASVQFRTVAGLSPVKWNNRRMHNIDLSDVVTGHMDYMKQLDTIMKVVGVRTKDDDIVRDEKHNQSINKKVTKDSSSNLPDETNINASEGNPGSNLQETDSESQEYKTTASENSFYFVGDSGINSPESDLLQSARYSYSSLELTDSDPDDVEFTIASEHPNKILSEPEIWTENQSDLPCKENVLKNKGSDLETLEHLDDNFKEESELTNKDTFNVTSNQSVISKDHVSQSGLSPDHVSQSGLSPDHVNQSGLCPDHVSQSGLSPDHVSQSGLSPENIQDLSIKENNGENCVQNVETHKHHSQASLSQDNT